MNFRIGQKVSYPNHGVCKIEKITKKEVSAQAAECYSLRVLANNSLIYVPVENAESIGVRPILNSSQCKNLMEFLAKDFEEPESDWKHRTREFSLKLQTGNIFETADVLKKLTFLACSKKLSFREQRLLEKSRLLIVSEIAAVCQEKECDIEKRVASLLECACERHCLARFPIVSAAAH
jgi:CarD family transcriptional regulator